MLSEILLEVHFSAYEDIFYVFKKPQFGYSSELNVSMKIFELWCLLKKF